jgi:hypothetical protein
MKTRSIIITICVLLLGATACNQDEFFELKRPAQSPWLTLIDLEKAPIGAYYCLSGNAGSRTIFAHARMAAELFADQVAFASASEGYPVSADAEDMYNRATGGTEIAFLVNGVFSSGYFAVGHANGALDFIEENSDDPFPNDSRKDEVRRIKGELYFVRAYAYYWLARMYLPAYPSEEKRIPLRIHLPTNFAEAIVSELASANDVYPLIVDDLQKAKELLPERYDPNLHPAAYADGRANKFAAAALLAKVHFHMGNYSDALSELNFVIGQNGGDYDLSEDPIEAWNKTGVNRGKEVIWYYTLWAGDGLGGSSNWKHPSRFQEYNACNSASVNVANNGSRYIRCSESFLKTVGWMNDDLSESPDALNDKRYTQLFVRYEAGGDPRAAFVPTKPYVWNYRYYRSGVNRSTNLPILRLADMYLLRATIQASNGQSGPARTDLNMVRNRAGIGDFTGADGDLLTAIEIERMKELAFEGDRLYYLQGLQKNIPNGDRGSGSVPWNGPFYSEVPLIETDVNLGYQ